MFNFLAVGRVGVQPGGDFRQERSALHRSGSTLDRAELPSHRYPQGNEPGREAVEIPAVQRFPEGKKSNSLYLTHSKHLFNETVVDFSAFWLPPTCSGVAWTSRESTSCSTTTCQRTPTPTFTGLQEQEDSEPKVNP